jgi:Xaa-Pro aminopeptidase
MKDIAQEKLGSQVRRIGLGAKGRMGAELFEAICAAFPGAEFINVDKPLEEMRGVKSQAEQAVIRYAYDIVNKGMEAALAAVRPGVTERQIAAEAEYVMRKMGCEGYGIDTIIASGPNAYHVLARTTNRVIEENDVVIITLAPRYEGYHGACGRTVIVGDPGEEIVKAVEAAVAAQKLCAENLVAGNVGSRVEAMGRAVMQEAGYGENFLYSGLHSVGVIEFEPPILGPSSSTVIEKDMVISIDIPLFEAPIPGVRVEDGYLITADGNIRLTDAPWFIRK